MTESPVATPSDWGPPRSTHGRRDAVVEGDVRDSRGTGVAPPSVTCVVISS